MFTGIIEGLAEVRSVTKAKKKGADTVMRVKLGSMAKGLKVGDSVCVSGACLTVTALSKKGEAQFEMVAETIRRTSLGSIKTGDMVNIERSMKVGDRLEGHFVLGHVDGIATIIDKRETQSETTMWFQLASKEEKNLSRAIVEKGSVAIDGISLTVVGVKGDRFSVSLIPHTLEITTLGTKKKGDQVNIETDVLSKYVAKSLPQNQ
ncbi:MAG: riboflavin synthase [Nitrososphaera sp.]